MSLTEVDAPAKPASRGRSSAKAWLRALELTAPIAGNHGRIFSTVIDERAEDCGDAPALLSDHESLTYRSLAERSNQYARWALDQGLDKGDTVGLMMPNRPEYMAIWLGITRVGCVVALINTNLAGPALSHCVNIVAPKHIIVAAELMDPLTAVLADLTPAAKIWVHGIGNDEFPSIDRDIKRHSGEKLSDAERRPVTIEA